MKLKLELNNLFRQQQISSSYFEILDQINHLESKTKLFSDTEIRDRVENLKKAFSNSENNPSIIAESFSLTREVAYRKLGLRHFETQLLGGLILNDGKIAE